MKNGKLKFQTVVDFEIDPDEAASLLADPFPSTAVDQWLIRNSPVKDDNTTYYKEGDRFNHNASELRTALGRYLADKKVAERKQLTEINIQPDEPIRADQTF